MIRRLVYAPRVDAYIQKGPDDNDMINISNDIIGGTITRRTEAPSTASLQLQNRGKKYNGVLRPMDKLIIYLRKTQPILAFSGYLDSVPFIQAKPGPVEITASCTLKLLEFTYFDPALPYFQQMMAKYVGAGEDDSVGIPQIGGSSYFFLDANNRDSDNMIEDVGFGRLLHFLVSEVGHWDPHKTHILPIPDRWVQSSIAMLERIREETEDMTQESMDLIKKILNESAKGAGGSSEGGSGSGEQVGSYSGANGVVITDTDEELAKKIDDYIKSKRANSPLVGFGKEFVKWGREFKIDPRFPVAISGLESEFATTSGTDRFNPFGIMLPGRILKTFPSFDGPDGSIHYDFWNFRNNPGHYFSANPPKTSIAAIHSDYAPIGAANDPQGLNSHWAKTVKKFYQEQGGDPEAPSVAWDTEGEGSGGSGDGSSGSGGSSSSSGGGSNTVRYRASARAGKVAITLNGSLLSSKTNGVKELVTPIAALNFPGMTIAKAGNDQTYTLTGTGSGSLESIRSAVHLIFSILAKWGKVTSGSEIQLFNKKPVTIEADKLKYIISPVGNNNNRFVVSLVPGSSTRAGNKNNIKMTSTSRAGGLRDTSIEVYMNGGGSSSSSSSSSSGSSSGSSGSSSSEDNNSGQTTTTTGESGKYTVYIEAGHSDPMQPGYTGQPGATGEKQKTPKMAEDIRNLLKNHPKIQIVDTTGSKPSGGPDIYVSIHFDASNPPVDAISYPNDHSTSRESGVLNPGKGEPHKYPQSKGGNPSEWVTPPRTNIHQNNALKKASKALAKAIAGETNQPTIDGAEQARMTNYYGFYYSLGKACVLIENSAPNGIYAPGGVSYNARIGKIADGIKKFVDSGAIDPGGGDDSPAAKLILACRRTAMKNNGGQGHGVLGYLSPGKRNVPLIEAEEANERMDCSGFIGNGMIEIGVKGKEYSPSTGSLISESGGDNAALPREQLKPGHLLIDGTTAVGSGPGEHVVLYCGNNEVVQCSGGNRGPNIAPLSGFGDSYKVYEHPAIGTTDSPPTGEAASGSGGGGGGNIQTLTPFGVISSVFTFPGDTMESLYLRGPRALENDVKLLQVVGEVAQASLRTFASHPNGDFMAWFPDYFNASGKTPYLLISDTELIDCTINLSDTNLATHVFMTSDIQGLRTIGGQTELKVLQHLTAFEVVNIEQAYLLDTFLMKVGDEKNDKVVQAISASGAPEVVNPDGTVSVPAANTRGNAPAEQREPIIKSDADEAIDEFLQRFGARPFSISAPTLSHPAMVFFMTYQWFQRKWAEQFESNVDFTFMPELFPGTIVGIESLGVAFYCDEVTHTFDYSSGFNTKASLMAPSRIGTDKAESPLGFGIAKKWPIKKAEILFPNDEPEEAPKIMKYKEWLKYTKRKSTKDTKVLYDKYVKSHGG